MLRQLENQLYFTMFRILYHPFCVTGVNNEDDNSISKKIKIHDLEILRWHYTQILIYSKLNYFTLSASSDSIGNHSFCQDYKNVKEIFNTNNYYYLFIVIIIIHYFIFSRA